MSFQTRHLLKPLRRSFIGYYYCRYSHIPLPNWVRRVIQTQKMKGEKNLEWTLKATLRVQHSRAKTDNSHSKMNYNQLGLSVTMLAFFYSLSRCNSYQLYLKKLSSIATSEKHSYTYEFTSPHSILPPPFPPLPQPAPSVAAPVAAAPPASPS